MGDAGGNMAHWTGFYGGGTEAETASFVTAAAATAAVSSPTSGVSGGGSPTRAHRPGVEGGRVGKPARRRSRASRRAPVTLLNTDTSNFRAMVQQFTGVPASSGPYGPGAGGGGPVISFGEYGGGGGAVPVRPSPTSAVSMSFDHLAQHRPPVSLRGQLFRPQHHQQQQYGGDVGYGGGDMSPFLHGFESSAAAEDRLLLQSMHAAQMLPGPASANYSNGYNFG